jgi:mutator protein MutT
VSSDHGAEPVHVVVGILIDADRRVLIAQRPAGKHLAGGWEFPGGKLEPGEHRLQGLARELLEELGIRIQTPRPLIRVKHQYPNFHVLLDVWVVRQFLGTPQGLEGQALRWCAVADLASANLLPADKPIVAALRLPERLTAAGSSDYTVSTQWRNYSAPEVNAVRDAPPMRGAQCSSVEEALEAAESGAEFLVMGVELSASQLGLLCDSVCVPVFAKASDILGAWALGASGVSEIE